MRRLALLGFVALLAGCAGGHAGSVLPAPPASAHGHARAGLAAAVNALSAGLWFVDETAPRLYRVPATATTFAPTTTIAGYTQSASLRNARPYTLVAGPDGTVYDALNFETSSGPDTLSWTIDAFGPAETTTPWQSWSGTGQAVAIFLVDDGVDVAVADPAAKTFEVRTYDYAANGASAPVRVLSLPPGLQGSTFAVDGTDELFVTDATHGQVLVYAPYASGNAAPMRTLTVAAPATPFNTATLTPGYNGVTSIAVDERGSLYAAVADDTGSGAGHVAVYAPGAGGSATPVRTITGLPNNEVQLAHAGDGNLYVADSAAGNVTVYDANASGAAAPVRTMTGVPSTVGGLVLGP